MTKLTDGGREREGRGANKEHMGVIHVLLN